MALKKKHTISFFGFCLLFFSVLSLKSQDIHFSQFWNTPLDVSPALAGVAKEDTRIFGAYKNQWASVPVGYRTFSGAIDTKWTPFDVKAGYFGFGAIFNHDQAGDSDWSLSNFNGLVSYTKQLAPRIFVSVGGEIGIGQRSFKLQNLTFDNQYNGEFFDPSIPVKEKFVNTQTVFMDAGIGLNIHLQKEDQRSKLDIGMGLHHLNTPSQNFYANSTIDLPVRKDFYAIGALKISQNFDVLANALFRYQAEFQEIIVGAGLRIHLNQHKTKELALELGGSLRTGDAILPFMGLLYHQWRFGFVYDINTSPFSNATRSNGGPEFTAIYTITQPKSPTHKICPLF